MTSTLEMSNDGCLIRPVRVTCSDVDVARDFRVDFFKLAPSRYFEFEAKSRAVKKL